MKPQEQFESLRKMLEDHLGKFVTDDEIKALSDKVKDLERKFVAGIPDIETRGQIPIVKGVFWKNEDQAKNFMQMAGGLVANDNEIIKTMTGGTDSEGGYLVPPDFRAMLVRLIEVFGLARQLCTVIPMRSLTLEMPKLTSSVTAYWIDEASPITESQPVFSNILLTAKKLAALVPVSSELMEDSSIAIANLLVTLFAEVMSEEEDRVAFVGDTVATDPFDGILKGATGELGMAAGETGFADLDANHLLTLTNNIPTSQQSQARFLMHRTVFNHVRGLTNSTGDYIWQQPTAAAPGTIWGWPYSLSDVMPSVADTAVDTRFILFGNFRHYYIGNRRNMSIASSQHFGFNTDRMFLRAIERIAMKMALGQAFAALKTAAV